ncbi:phage resistance protein [Parafrankia colletiae]|uniref:Phage resistance protein n=1 Tax=Parafrankia colletiae TaxID=573497 RepID=A0A1S1QM45_9ACTN|nr:phage resistance protein [Parafrankia colletiae]MCK9900621.1 phage resistance protein [Frankia sp. Cpl3]OHV34656.1 phage resistance protein [Parafrankia colletiae]
MTSPSSQPLLREVIDIPERTSDSDFVLRLTEGVTDVQATLRDYVITDRLVGNFDEALGLIAQAVSTRTSKGVYLHGSFGSGKSHFMAVLHALLRGEPAARTLDERLTDVLGKHDGELAGKRFLLVPFHMLGAKSIEQRVLGGYADHLRALHPGAPVPAVHRAEALLAEARSVRAKVGDAMFLGVLNQAGSSGAGTASADGGAAPAVSAGDEEDEWGDDTSWTSADLDAALAPPPPAGIGGSAGVGHAAGADSAGDTEHAKLRRRLVSDLLTTWFANTFRDLREDADGFVSLDAGLTEIARHAQDLGYDAVVLFLDELILWLANNMGDSAFVSREVQKVTNFVEGGLGARPVPVVSFIARQRDLRELVGESIAGDVRLSFLDVLTLADGRFDKIVLEDRNLPLIANRRLLRPRDADAAAAVARAFETTAKVRVEVWDTMLGGSSQLGADRDAFRLSYPFSPAFMDTLVHVSSALQRNRTALKLMRQLLVDHRDDLRLGQVVPLGDLWDVITRGADTPFTDVLKAEFDAAQKLYARKLRPYLLDAEGLDEDTLARVRRAQSAGPGSGSGSAAGTGSAAGLDPALATKVRRFTADDRLVKTLLLSALAPSVPALRNLTPRRLSALNHGSITSPIPGGEAGLVGKKVERWAGQFGEIKFLPVQGGDPGVGLELVDVEVDSILNSAVAYDSAGNRRSLVKRLLVDELGVTVTGDAYGDRLDLVWKGSRRSAEVIFGSVRGQELRDDQLAPVDPDAWRIVLDYPFDDTGDGPVYARARVERLRGAGAQYRTVCWIPADLTAARLTDLGMLVRLDHLLAGGGHRFDSHAQHLSADDRQRARGVLKSRYDALLTKTRAVLRSAYGLTSKDEQDVTADYSDHLRALWPGLSPALPLGASFREAVRRIVGDLLADQFPGHPDLDPDRTGTPVKPAELRLVLGYVTKAAEADGGSVEVARGDRVPMRRIAPALGLGVMHEVRFELGRDWADHFTRRAAQTSAGSGTAGPGTVGSGPAGSGTGGEGPGELRVADLLTWIDEPKPRGLEDNVAHLIVAAFAEQTDRAWYRYGGLLATPPELTAVTRDMTLREQPLPALADWETACARAEALFGVPRPALRRGRLLRGFADDIVARARPLRPASQELVDVLEERAVDLGLDPRTGLAAGRESAAAEGAAAGSAAAGSEAGAGDGGRLRSARAARDLLAALDGAGTGAAVVERLARADLAVPAKQLAATLSRAGAVAAAVRTAPWDETFAVIVGLAEPYQTEARAILGQIHAAGVADELITPLAPALRTARVEATALLRRATSSRSLTTGETERVPPQGEREQGGGDPTGGSRDTDPAGLDDAVRIRVPGRDGITGGRGVEPGRSGGHSGDGEHGEHGEHGGGGGGVVRTLPIRAGEADRALAELRDLIGGRPGELQIIWRPAT